MKNILNFTLVLSFVLTSTFGNAQSVLISGNVTESSGEGLPGALVFCKNRSVSVITDANGGFSIKCTPGKDTLVVSFIGYISEMVPVRTKTNIKISLKENVKVLDEVVIVGYVAVRKSYMTGAVSSVETKSSTKDLPSQKIINYDNAAAGPGVLTAGELNDFSKWNLWNDIANKELSIYQKLWEFRPIERYTVQFQTEHSSPIVDAIVKLKHDTSIIWVARTDNTGKAELWANAFSSATKEKLKYHIEITNRGETYKKENIKVFHKGINIVKAPLECEFPNKVDVAFIVDATGSMQDEINYLKAELNDIISKIQDTLPILSINLASVFYRDEGDDYVTKVSDFSNDISRTTDFIKENNADGGGDTPEAVDKALEVALNDLAWSTNALARLAFLILDAPPHEDKEVKGKLKTIIQLYAAKGIKLIPITCSGIDKGTEYLMRSFSLLTNGTYLFLTDHSGVGNKHIEPTTDTYDVELLNKLLRKIIIQSSFIPDCQKVEAISTTDSIKVAITPKPEVEEDSAANNGIDNKTATIDKTSKGQSWKFYPNPTHGNITLEMEGQFGEIFITDLRGKILERILVKNRQHIETDISKYPSGIYLIRYEYKPNKWLDGRIILVH